MPGGDGTGPAGMGPMTGRAAGYCAGYGAPGYANPGCGRGFWGRGRGGRGFWGRGGGRGWRNWFYATGIPGWQRGQYGYPMPYEPAPEQELSMLKHQSQDMQEDLADINNRIKELEAEKGSK